VIGVEIHSNSQMNLLCDLKKSSAKNQKTILVRRGVKTLPFYPNGLVDLANEVHQDAE